MVQVTPTNSRKPLIIYLINVALNLLCSLFVTFIVIGSGGNGTGWENRYTIIFIITIVYAFLHPIYLAPFLYMRKNETKSEHSHYSGLNISLLSITAGLTMSFIFFCIAFVTFFLIQRDFQRILSNSNYPLPVEFWYRAGMGTSITEVYSEQSLRRAFMEIFFWSVSWSVIYIIYGVIRAFLDFKQKTINNEEKALFKKLLVLSTILFLIPNVAAVVRYTQNRAVINKALASNSIQVCEELNYHETISNCREEFAIVKKDLLACKDLDSGKVGACLYEAAKHDTNWQKCLEYSDNMAKQLCIREVGGKSDDKDNTARCKILHDLYIQKKDTSAHKFYINCYARIGSNRNDTSVCRELQDYTDLNECIDTYNQFILDRQWFK